MEIASHNNILGWVDGFKITRNNFLFGRPYLYSTPYKPIIANPTLVQCWKNWNIADTGMVFATVIASIFLSYPYAFRSSISIMEKRTSFTRLVGLSWFIGLILGLRNSSYRLEGLVPNGLEKNLEADDETIKYDFTSDFLGKSIWGYVFPSYKDKQ